MRRVEGRVYLPEAVLYVLSAVLLLITAIWTRNTASFLTMVEGYCGVLLYWGMAIGCILPKPEWRFMLMGGCLAGQGIIGILFDILGNQIELLALGYCVIYLVLGAALFCAAIPEVKFLRWPHLQKDLLTISGVLAILMAILYGAFAVLGVAGVALMAVRSGSWVELLLVIPLLLLPLSSIANLLLIRRCERMGKPQKRSRKK